MTDNVNITEGVGKTIATEDVGGIQYQRIKVYTGAPNTATNVSAANPFPVTVNGGEYEAVAASQTTQALGATGAVGDFLSGLLVVPATTSPGAISIKDGSLTAMTVFTGGGSSVTNLVPFFIPVGAKSVSGAWQVTTGANVSCIGLGDFT